MIAPNDLRELEAAIEEARAAEATGKWWHSENVEKFRYESGLFAKHGRELVAEVRRLQGERK